MQKRKQSAEAMYAASDGILTEIERFTDLMPLSQAREFLTMVSENITNMMHDVDDQVSSIRADTVCTCNERGRLSLHTKACAKTKAVK